MTRFGRLHRFNLLYLLVAARFLVFGFKYYPQLDDYIQYINFSNSNDLWQVVIDQGLLGARPLAGLLDVFLWSKFSEILIIPVLIISALWALSGILFFDSLKEHFNIGNGFLIIYALLPYGFEGLYWLSASTRIAVGLFFASLSGSILDMYFNSGRKRYLPFFLIFAACAISLYEQVLVFCVVYLSLLTFLNIKKAGKRAYWIFTLPAVLVAYYLFTKAFSDSVSYSQRMVLADFSTEYYFGEFLPMLAEQFSEVFVKGNFAILFKGFVRGVEIIFTERLWLYAALVILLCALVYITDRKRSGNKKINVFQIFAGFLLALAPLAPFFVIDQPWFSFRGAVTSFCGIALLADGLLHLLKEKPYRIIAATLCLVCCISAVSELYDYRATNIADNDLLNAVSEVIDEENDGEKRIGILNVSPTYLEEQNYYYHEHIHGVSESEWCLTAAFVAKSNMWPEPQLVPLPFDGYLYKHWNYDTNNLSVFDALFYYEGGKLVSVNAEKTDTGYLITDSKGNKMFEIEEKDKMARVVKSYLKDEIPY